MPSQAFLEAARDAELVIGDRFGDAWAAKRNSACPRATWVDVSSRRRRMRAPGYRSALVGVTIRVRSPGGMTEDAAVRRRRVD
jgi:hypothetical protein